jgi:hypothetical protein
LSVLLGSSRLRADALFVRGDVDANGSIEITDAVRLLGFLFLGGEAPPCRDAADVDDDGATNVTDAIRILGFLFRGTVPPAPPTPRGARYSHADCGADSGVRLGCADFPPCASNLVSVLETSPAAGESAVGVQRDAAVYFDGPVAPASTGDAEDAVVLLAAGERLAGTVRFSSTGRFVTFSPDAGLPPSMEIRLVVDGGLLVDGSGRLVDADGDGQPGGRAVVDFRTVALARVPGTAVSGTIRDSYSQAPIEAVEIRIDGLPDGPHAVTDRNGFFRLQDTPAPELFVVIDGARAVNAPPGTVYPTLGKPFHSVPGVEVPLVMNGRPFDIYLPPMALGDLQELDPVQGGSIGFGPAGLDRLREMLPGIDPEAWSSLRVEVPAGSALAADGNVAAPTAGVVIPVNPRFLPAPLPPNIDVPLVVSVQLLGAERFDVPAPMTFPNLEGLAEGEPLVLMSFDHQAGRWSVVGSGSVARDQGTGRLVVASDPGSGIRAPGWHLFARLARVLGQAFVAFLCIFPNLDAGLDAAGLEYAAAFSKLNSIISFLDVPPWIIFGPEGLALDQALNVGNFATAVLAEVFDSCVPDPRNCTISNPTAFSLYSSFVTFILGLDPRLDTLVANQLAEAFLAFTNANISAQAAKDLLNQAHVAWDEYRRALLECIEELRRRRQGGGAGADPIDERVDALEARTVAALEEAIAIYRNTAELMTSLIDLARILGFLPKGQGIDDPETIETILGLLDRLRGALEFFASRGYSSPDAAASVQARVLREVRREGIEIFAELSEPAPPSAGAYYAFLRRDGPLVDAAEGQAAGVDPDDRVVARGRTDREGRWTVTLRPETEYGLVVYDPHTNGTWEDVFRTGRSRDTVRLTAFPVVQRVEDSDADGLSDAAEAAVGTRVDLPDTDSDGIGDLAEVSQGLDPLGGRLLPTGIVATLPLRGQAVEVELTASIAREGLTAYVATGSQGLAIVDVSTFSAPVLQGRFVLPSGSRSEDVAADARLQLAALAAGEAGLYVLDVRDPLAPRLAYHLDVVAQRLEAHDGVLFVASGAGLIALSFASGAEIDAVLPSHEDIVDLSRDGQTLFSMDRGRVIRAFDVSGIVIQERGSVALPHGGGRIFAGGGVVYAAAEPGYSRGGFSTVDASDPDALVVCSDSDVVSPRVAPGRVIVANGSGKGVLIGSPNAVPGNFLEVVDLSRCEDTDVSLPAGQGGILFPEARVELPGSARSVAISGGLAFVADGSAGLHVVNFLPFDVRAEAPRFRTLPAIEDVHPEIPGIQVVTGSRVSVSADLLDDVQVSEVDLRVDGRLEARDASFPFDLSFQAFGGDAGSRTLQVEITAIDTGRNIASVTIEVELVPDNIPPRLVSSDPPDGGLRGEGLSRVGLQFSEPLDAAAIETSAFTLVAEDGSENAATGLTTARDDSYLELDFAPLAPGSYELRVAANEVSDRAGNPLAEDGVLVSFTVVQTTIRYTGLGSEGILDPANWEPQRTPTAQDFALIELPGLVPVEIESALTVGGILVTEPLTIDGAGRLHVLGRGFLEGDVALLRGRLVADGTVDVSGFLTWSGGTISGSGRVVARGGLRMTGGFKFLEGRLDNASIGTWDAGNIANNGRPSRLENLAGAALVVNAGVSLARNIDGASFPSFANAGRFVVAAASETVVIGATLEQTGEVEVTSGLLRLSRGGGSRGGSFLIGKQAVVEFQGEHTTDSGTSFEGAGEVHVAGGTLLAASVTIAPRVRVSGGTLAVTPGTRLQDLVLSGGALESAGGLTVHGAMEWSGGAVRVGDALLAGGALRIAGGLKVLEGRIEMVGTAEWTAGNIVNNGRPAELRTAGGSALTIRGAVALTRNTNTGVFPAVRNEGETTAAAVGTVLLRGLVQNFGRLSVRSGTLEIRSLEVHSGAVHLEGGILCSPEAIDVLAGELAGAGSVLADLVNSGVVSVGGDGVGSLTVVGNYEQLGSGQLRLDLAGAAASEHDVLIVIGRGSFGGRLHVRLAGGYAPAGGESFELLRFGALEGGFHEETYPAAPPGFRYTLRSDPTPPTRILVELRAQP